MEVEADDGRIYLPKKSRERHGTRFEMIDRGDKIILVPISENPLEALRDEVGELDKTVEELKEQALETAMETAGK